MLTTLGGSRSAATPGATLAVLGDATAATQQLIPNHDKMTDDQERQVERLRASLQDLLATTLFLTSTSGSDSRASAFRAAAGILHEKTETSAVVDEPVVLLAREVRDRYETVVNSLGLRKQP